MNWDHFRFLLALARAESLSGAARRLGVDQTTVARRLAAAEAALGHAVFDRADGRFIPTIRGVDVLNRAADMEIAVEDACYPDTPESPQGAVRVTAVPWLIQRVLVPNYDAFGTAYPGIALSLLPDSQNLSVTRREADIALRFARPDGDSGALSRRVGRVDFVPCRSAESPAETLPWIAYDAAAGHLPQAVWIDAQADPAPGGLKVADLETAIAAVQAGIGRTLLPAPVAAGLPGIAADGPPVLEREIWMLIHARSRTRPSVSAVADWLISALRRGNFA